MHCCRDQFFVFIYSHQELQVRVQGARPGNILFLIHEVLESLITESFAGVTYDFLLPCPECLALNVSLREFPVGIY